MKKYLLLAAATMAFGTAAHAAPSSGSLTDPDGSGSQQTWTGNTADNQFEDAGSSLTTQYTIKGSVTATCSMYGADDVNPGLTGTLDLGTIGIVANDEQGPSSQFNMAGPASVNVHANSAGCNAKNTLAVTKNSAGLVNAVPGSYDSNQFQANIPYSVDVAFTGVTSTAGAVAGTLQHVTVGSSAASSAPAAFGAWRSALDLNVTIPQVSGKGLVAGTYQDTVTMTLALAI